MSLPLGTWKMNINGEETDFQISLADGSGLFNATIVNLQRTVSGFWDEASQTVTFGLAIGQENVIMFKGYLFRTPPNPEPGRDIMATLVGVAQVNAMATRFLPANARRNVFGWFAQITEVV
jgi:hypothetical protein